MQKIFYLFDDILNNKCYFIFMLIVITMSEIGILINLVHDTFFDIIDIVYDIFYIVYDVVYNVVHDFGILNEEARPL